MAIRQWSGVPVFDGDLVNNVGAVMVFDRTGANWDLTQVLFATDFNPADYFGISVDIDGTRIAVGASGDDQASANAGAVYVFELTGGRWSEEAKLVASDGEASDAMGASVAIEGDIVVAGAPTADSTGADAGRCLYL